MAESEFIKMQKQIDELTKKVSELERKLSGKTGFQEDFIKNQIVKREVTFKYPVYNAAGTKVIN